jgi:hypothetical protein
MFYAFHMPRPSHPPWFDHFVMSTPTLHENLYYGVASQRNEWVTCYHLWMGNGTALFIQQIRDKCSYSLYLNRYWLQQDVTLEHSPNGKYSQFFGLAPWLFVVISHFVSCVLRA